MNEWIYTAAQGSIGDTEFQAFMKKVNGVCPHAPDYYMFYNAVYWFYLVRELTANSP